VRGMIGTVEQQEPSSTITAKTGSRTGPDRLCDGDLHFANVVNLVGDGDIDTLDKVAGYRPAKYEEGAVQPGVGRGNRRAIYSRDCEQQQGDNRIAAHGGNNPLSG
jgi:hypothetical protein